MPMYAVMTAPAMVAIPAVMTRNISERFIRGRYSLASRGASHCPRKMFPATVSPSAPEMRNMPLRHQAKSCTIFCMMCR